MYKIVNNNILITRGETATYNVKLIDKATGAPFILPPSVYDPSEEDNTHEISKFVIVFGVRRSDYIKDGYAVKKILWLCGIDDVTNLPEEQYKCTDVILLDDTKIYNYLDDIWDPDYFGDSGERLDPDTLDVQLKTRNVCYRKKLTDGAYEYRYWNTETNTWTPYSFTIRFPFLYSDTAALSPKSYKYAMTIYGGNNLEIVDGKLNENTIDYKKPLVDAQFIVEADINE